MLVSPKNLQGGSGCGQAGDLEKLGEEGKGDTIPVDWQGVGCRQVVEGVGGILEVPWKTKQRGSGWPRKPKGGLSGGGVI